VQDREKGKCKVHDVVELEGYMLRKLRMGDFKNSIRMKEGRRQKSAASRITFHADESSKTTFTLP
jgi:hypothetical protein